MPGGHILRDSASITFQKRQDFRNSGQISGCQRLGMGLREGKGGSVVIKGQQEALVIMVMLSILISEVDSRTHSGEKTAED